ncbi:MAG: hypothetical protein V7746_07050 [Halioglobus sp.]
MKTTILNVFFTAILTLVPLAASALENQAAYNDVNTSLTAGTSPADIISALIQNYELTLTQATVFAMVSGGEGNRSAFATAGVESAANYPEAQSVVVALKAAAGQTGAVANAADAALVEYSKLMPQPYIHHDDNIPTGGGARTPVSPSD